MILWVILFALVVAISFVLAAQSMRDFSEVPEKSKEYSLYLIRNIQALNKDLVDSISAQVTKTGTIVAFERLFKGGKSALVIFGAKKVLLAYSKPLDLLELEDYTDINDEDIFAWEAGVKSNEGWTMDNIKLFSNMPILSENEHFWWQVILSSSQKVQITGIITSPHADRRHHLAQKIQHLTPEVVFKLPKAYSNSQLLEFYKKRSLRGENKNPKLISEKILQLILI